MSQCLSEQVTEQVSEEEKYGGREREIQGESEFLGE